MGIVLFQDLPTLVCQLQSWRFTEQWSDLTICCSDGTMRVHKLVIATVSPLMNAVLEHCDSIILPDFKVEELDIVLDTFYTGQTSATPLSLKGAKFVFIELLKIFGVDVPSSLPYHNLDPDTGNTILQAQPSLNSNKIHFGDFSHPESENRPKCMLPKVTRAMSKPGVPEKNSHIIAAESLLSLATLSRNNSPAFDETRSTANICKETVISFSGIALDDNSAFMDKIGNPSYGEIREPPLQTITSPSKLSRPTSLETVLEFSFTPHLASQEQTADVFLSDAKPGVLEVNGQPIEGVNVPKTTIWPQREINTILVSLEDSNDSHNTGCDVVNDEFETCSSDVLHCDLHLSTACDVQCDESSILFHEFPHSEAMSERGEIIVGDFDKFFAFSDDCQTVLELNVETTSEVSVAETENVEFSHHKELDGACKSVGDISLINGLGSDPLDISDASGHDDQYLNSFRDQNGSTAPVPCAVFAQSVLAVSSTALTCSRACNNNPPDDIVPPSKNWDSCLDSNTDIVSVVPDIHHPEQVSENDKKISQEMSELAESISYGRKNRVKRVGNFKTDIAGSKRKGLKSCKPSEQSLTKNPYGTRKKSQNTTSESETMINLQHPKKFPKEETLPVLVDPTDCLSCAEPQMAIEAKKTDVIHSYPSNNDITMPWVALERLIIGGNGMPVAFSGQKSEQIIPKRKKYSSNYATPPVERPKRSRKAPNRDFSLNSTKRMEYQECDIASLCEVVTALGNGCAEEINDTSTFENAYLALIPDSASSVKALGRRRKTNALCDIPNPPILERCDVYDENALDARRPVTPTFAAQNGNDSDFGSTYNMPALTVERADGIMPMPRRKRKDASHVLKKKRENLKQSDSTSPIPTFPPEQCESDCNAQAEIKVEPFEEYELTDVEIRALNVLNCEVCDKPFKREFMLNKHMLTHTRKRQYNCPICGIAYKCRGSMLYHRRAVHNTIEIMPTQDREGSSYLECNHAAGKCGGIYTCLVCSKRFNMLSTFKVHLALHLGLRKFKCGLCQRLFSEKCRAQEHVAEAHRKQPRQTERFVSKQDLGTVVDIIKRIRQATQLPSSRAGRCRRLKNSGNGQLPSPSLHLENTYNDSSICETCCMVFEDKACLKRHSLEHLRIKAYRCMLCPAEFYIRGTMRRHLGAVHKKSLNDYHLYFDHLEESISDVLEAFQNGPLQGGANNPDLREAKRKLVSVKRKQDYSRKIQQQMKEDVKCEVCEKQFRVPAELVRHMRVHTGEKPFTCSVCGRRFSVLSGVRQHLIKVHAKDKQRLYRFILKDSNLK